MTFTEGQRLGSGLRRLVRLRVFGGPNWRSGRLPWTSSLRNSQSSKRRASTVPVCCAGRRWCRCHGEASACERDVRCLAHGRILFLERGSNE